MRIHEIIGPPMHFFTGSNHTQYVYHQLAVIGEDHVQMIKIMCDSIEIVRQRLSCTGCDDGYIVWREHPTFEYIHYNSGDLSENGYLLYCRLATVPKINFDKIPCYHLEGGTVLRV